MKILRFVFLCALLPFSLFGSQKSRTSDLLRSVVAIHVPDGKGSGVIVSPFLILTANHVVSAHVMEPVLITFKGGETVVGTVIVSDSYKDVALVKTEIPSGYVKLPIKKALPDLDELLTVIGHPRGLQWSVTRGYLANSNLVNVELDAQCKQNCHEMLIDGRSGYGNSGGPIINEAGQIVGIMNAFSEDPPFTYGVPSSEICKISILDCVE